MNPQLLEAEAFVEAVAQRVVELLQADVRTPRLVTASELAHELSIDRAWVYAHSSELGAVRLGEGPRARLRFDSERAAQALARRGAAAPAAPPTAKRRGRPRKTGLPDGIQPLRGRKERG